MICSEHKLLRLVHWPHDSDRRPGVFGRGPFSNRSGVIQLTELTKRYNFQQAKRSVAPPPIATVECLLGDLGKLGGHLTRVSDGHPGSEVLWRGMARLADIEIVYDLYH